MRAWTTWLAVGAGVVVGAAAIWIGLREPASDHERVEAPEPAASRTPPLLAPPGHVLLGVDPTPGRVLRIVTRGDDGRGHLCEVGDDDEDAPPLARARCAPVDRAGPLFGSDDGGPALMRVDASLVDGAGATVGSLEGVTDVWGLADGSVWVLGGEPLRLARLRGGDTEIDLAHTNHATLVGGWVVALDRPDAAPDVLVARALAVDADDERVGEVTPKTSRIHGCRSPTALAVVTDGEIIHGQRELSVAFRHQGDGAWSRPVGETATIAEYALTCRGTEATLTWLRADVVEQRPVWVVAQIRCTPDGCSSAEAALEPDGADPTAVDVDGAVLLVWADRGTTRARLAPLEDLPAASELELPRTAAPVLARHVWARGAAAIVAERTASGLGAMRIDARGARLLPIEARPR